MAWNSISDPTQQDGQMTSLQMLRAEGNELDRAFSGMVADGLCADGPASFNVFGKTPKSGLEVTGAMQYEQTAGMPSGGYQGFAPKTTSRYTTMLADEGAAVGRTDVAATDAGRYSTMSVADDAAGDPADFGTLSVAPRPTPTAPVTDAPEQKAISPGEQVEEAEEYLAKPTISRKEVTGADGTDALIFKAMFLFIDFQRREVASMMETVKYNNDMARQIEQYKVNVNAAADRARGKEGQNPTVKLDDTSPIDYMWNQNLTFDGQPFRMLYPDLKTAREKGWTATELTQMATALDIKRTEFTDMNSQSMQLLQMALGLLQVFQQMLTGLIDAWKRVKEGVAQKMS